MNDVPTLKNEAFELLRTFKDCSEDTERLVVSIIRKKFSWLTSKELYSVFQSGIAGDYGKVYSLDPETLLSWVKKFQKEKDETKNYLDSPLIPISTHHGENINWLKEANKCYKAFLNGVSEEYFHPAVYDRMMLDDKIKMNSYLKKLLGQGEPEDIRIAKQKILKDVFTEYKSRGLTFVYFIR